MNWRKLIAERLEHWHLNPEVCWVNICVMQQPYFVLLAMENKESHGEQTIYTGVVDNTIVNMNHMYIQA